MASAPTYSYRAQCFNVVDGDTVDLLVDLGFRHYEKTRFRLARINCPELNSPDAQVRAQAQTAKGHVASAILQTINWDSWPLRIETKKDPDNYGRWLCDIFYDKPGVLIKTCLNDELLELGLAVLYKS